MVIVVQVMNTIQTANTAVWTAGTVCTGVRNGAARGGRNGQWKPAEQQNQCGDKPGPSECTFAHHGADGFGWKIPKGYMAEAKKNEYCQE